MNMALAHQARPDGTSSWQAPGSLEGSLEPSPSPSFSCRCTLLSSPTPASCASKDCCEGVMAARMHARGDQQRGGDRKGGEGKGETRGALLGIKFPARALGVSYCTPVNALRAAYACGIRLLRFARAGSTTWRSSSGLSLQVQACLRQEVRRLPSWAIACGRELSASWDWILRAGSSRYLLARTGTVSSGSVWQRADVEEVSYGRQ